MTKYVAFLRGINVGGINIISMKDLVELFEKNGLKNVKTILASGNAIFESKEIAESGIIKKIEKAIKEKFDFEIVVQVIRFEIIKKLVEKNPYAQYANNKNVHLYVTFLNNFDGKLPHVSGENFELLSFQNDLLFSVLDRQNGKSTDFMTFLNKTFGKKVTTRNWNTLVKIAAAVA